MWARSLPAPGASTLPPSNPAAGTAATVKLPETTCSSGSGSPACTARRKVRVHTSPTDSTPSALLPVRNVLAPSRSPSTLSVRTGLIRSGLSAEEVLVTTTV